jgi:hypothetical protein
MSLTGSRFSSDSAPRPFHHAIRRQGVGADTKSAPALGGALSAPATAFLYDWNMLPIGQQLWLKHLSSYEKFPPLQEAETYDLGQVLERSRCPF